MSFTLNPFTGNFDIVDSSGFHKDYYTGNLFIPIYRQLVLYGKLTIDETLTIDGTVAII